MLSKEQAKGWKDNMDSCTLHPLWQKTVMEGGQTIYYNCYTGKYVLLITTVYDFTVLGEKKINTIHKVLSRNFCLGGGSCYKPTSQYNQSQLQYNYQSTQGGKLEVLGAPHWIEP